MSSRLRFFILTPKDRRLYGAAALVHIRACLSAKSWPKVNWAEVDAEGKARGRWVQLRVWRERRGTPNSDSDYFHDCGRQGSSTPQVLQERANAIQRRISAQARARRVAPPRPNGWSLGELARTGSAQIRLAATRGNPRPPEPVRPGIFARPRE